MFSEEIHNMSFICKMQQCDQFARRVLNELGYCCWCEQLNMQLYPSQVSARLGKRESSFERMTEQWIPSTKWSVAECQRACKKWLVVPVKGQQPWLSLNLAPEPPSPSLLGEPGAVKSTHTFLEAAVTISCSTSYCNEERQHEKLHCLRCFPTIWYISVGLILFLFCLLLSYFLNPVLSVYATVCCISQDPEQTEQQIWWFLGELWWGWLADLICWESGANLFHLLTLLQRWSCPAEEQGGKLSQHHWKL